MGGEPPTRASPQQRCVFTMSKPSKRLTTSTPIQGSSPYEETAAGPATSSIIWTYAPLRRALLIGNAAAGVLAARVAAAAGASLASSDAEPIGLCTDLDAMERCIGDLFDFAPSGPTDPKLEAADAAAFRIELNQRRVLDRICGLVPANLAGYMALVSSLALVSPHLVDAPAEAAMEERLTSMLLRGLRRSAS